MTGNCVRGLRSRRCVRRACLRAVAGAVFRACGIASLRVPAGLCPQERRRRRIVVGRTRCGRRQEKVQQPLFGVQFGLVGDVFDLFFAHHVDGDLGQVANHRLHIAAHVADFGELRGFDFKKGRVGELGQAAGDLGFADAGGADHDDVLRNDFFGQLGRQLLPAHAVAQGDRHGALGVLLADHILVEFGHDLARRQFVERSCSSSAVGENK